MRCRWANVAFVVALVALGVATPGSAAAQQSLSDVRVDLNLKDADLLTATKMLTTQTGVQFIFEPSNEPFGKITLSVKGQTAEDAISYICKSAGAAFRRDENGVYIIGRTQPKVDSKPVVAVPKAKVFKKIPILKAFVRDVYDQVVRNQIVDDMGYGRYIELKKFNRLASSQLQQELGYGPANYTNGRPNAYTPAIVSDTPRSVSNAETGGDIRLPDEQSNQIGGRGGSGFGNSGGSGFGNNGGNGFGNNGGNGFGNNGGNGFGNNGGGGNAYMEGGRGLVGESIDYISYDPNDNSFVVRGSEEDINKLQGYIQMFDVAPVQVVVKVEFVTTTESYERDLGYEFLYQRGTVFAGTTPGTFANAADPIFINYASGNVAGRLRAAMTQGLGKVVTAPIVRTFSNQVGQVYTTVTQVTWIPNISQGNGGNVTTYSQSSQDVPTYLSVAPRVNGDGTITMYLQPQISDQTGTSTSPDGQTVPVYTSQGVQVVVRVKDGETAVLGGMTKKQEDAQMLKVPVLGDLPIFGQFFRKNHKTRNNSELLIFVTPTVVKDLDDSGLPTGP